MIAFELLCLAIVGSFLWIRSKRETDKAEFFERYLRCCVAAWWAEETVIHAYGFYAYAPEWTLWLDRVPLMVVLIWPVVIASAWDLARAWRSGAGWRLAAFGGLIVLTDAALIEPIAVRAGLWRWYEPGIFDVPPVGLLGWAVFAAICLHAEEQSQGSTRPRRWLTVVLRTFLGTHAFLLLAWWGALRWVNEAISDSISAAVAGGLSLALVGVILKSKWARLVLFQDLMMRLPPALVFFALLAFHFRRGDPLLVYAVAFSLPYLVLCWQGRRLSAACPAEAELT